MAEDRLRQSSGKIMLNKTLNGDQNHRSVIDKKNYLKSLMLIGRKEGRGEDYAPNQSTRGESDQRAHRSLNGTGVNISMDDYSQLRSQNPIEHNYAKANDLQLNAKIKTFYSKKTSIDPSLDLVSQAYLPNEPIHKIPMMSRTGMFATGKNKMS